MLRSLIAAALAFACAASAAEARPVRQSGIIVCSQTGCQPQAAAPSRKAVATHALPRSASNDPRPGRWCAWWLRRQLGIPKSAFRAWEYNLARSFRYIGSAASGPAVGVIVVWRSHVGIITGRTDAGWTVLSGNDGGAVRERERPLKGAIAYRWQSSFAGISDR